MGATTSPAPVRPDDPTLLLCDTPNYFAVDCTLHTGEPGVTSGDVLRNDDRDAVLVGRAGGQGIPRWQVDGGDSPWRGASLAVGDLHGDGIDDPVADARTNVYGFHGHRRLPIWFGPLDHARRARPPPPTLSPRRGPGAARRGFGGSAPR